VAANDDFGGLETSQVQFGANAGQTYYISVDGFNGATGDIIFQLSLVSSVNLQPTVLIPERRTGFAAGRPIDPDGQLSSPRRHMWICNGIATAIR
jgi:hypothetical protein